MSTVNSVFLQNLGAEFDNGTIEANKIRLKIGSGLSILPDGTIIVSPVVPILKATAAANNNIHGANGTQRDITWNATTNVGASVDGFANGDNIVTALVDANWKIQTSVAVLDNAANNRTTYDLRVRHLDSANALITEYVLGSTYLRDDNNTYDSGLVGGFLEIPMSAGDSIQVRTEVLDVQTVAATVNANTTLSKLIIHA